MTDQGEITKIHLHLQAEGCVQTGCQGTGHVVRPLSTTEPEPRSDLRFHWPVNYPVLSNSQKMTVHLSIAVVVGSPTSVANQCRPVPSPRLLALIANSSMQSYARFHASEAGTGFG